ncbi:hypothetical protein B0X55_04485 [Helicobacter pylori]|nr:hypothetical protein B0X30_00795 [Helicobacter pylori]OOQ04042.1 hypothetical protein B0X44_02165 [Helicobacter pylori]OOQ23949.1 hypothetical protein B0X55_04485 [Helicobacter pylori]
MGVTPFKGMMRKRLNALWTLKLCKIPMIETQSESQTLPQHQSKSLNTFSVWAFHFHYGV